jgi:hypothetical protein
MSKLTGTCAAGHVSTYDIYEVHSTPWRCTTFDCDERPVLDPVTVDIPASEGAKRVEVPVLALDPSTFVDFDDCDVCMRFWVAGSPPPEHLAHLKGER